GSTGRVEREVADSSGKRQVVSGKQQAEKSEQVAIDHSTSSTTDEQLTLTGKVRTLYDAAWIIGGCGILVALLLGYLLDKFSLRQFFFGYLVSFMYFLRLLF